MIVDRLSDLVDSGLATQEPPAGALEDLAALEDTQVLDVLVDVARSRVGILLEARQSGAVPAGNAVVLVTSGMRDLRWARAGEITRVHALRVVGGGVTPDEHGHQLLLQCEPHADLVVVGESTRAYFVDVPDLPRAPVDYAEVDPVIRAGTPSWGHGAAVVAAWRLHGA